MSTILVVDDALSDRTLVSGIAAKWSDSRILQAEDGRVALAMIEQDPPDLILTDMHMPEMDGLELVTAVRETNPSIPIILMTAKGSEEIAARALRAGAASYVPKRRLAQDLIDTIRQVHNTSRGERTQVRLMHHATSTDTTFVLFNDRGLIRAAVDQVLNMLRCLPLRDQTERLRVGIALEEALNNASYHGNLQVRDEAGDDKRRYPEVAGQRSFTDPWKARRIHLRINIDRNVAEFTVRDDGDGFDWQHWMSLPDDDQSDTRGIALMRSVMDEVTFNETGNQITLLKHRFVDVLGDDDEED